MSFLSETASAIKSRFGYHKRTSSSTSLSDFLPNVKSTPDLHFKSAAKDTGSLSFRSFSDIGQDEDDSKIAPSKSFEFHEDPSFWKDNNVQVIIRVRPLSSSEISLQGHSKCVRQDSPQSITWIGNPESRFTFDLCADENVSQEMLFKVAGVPMVENCMGGYNSCMFAYGQTGSGKTHTMLGDIEGGTRRHSLNCGMTPRVFEFLFSRIQKEREVRREEKIRFTCKCSFLEIYNEHILDLLDPSSFNLQIREDNKKGIYVENLTEIEVASSRDVMQQLLQGANNRKVAATNMNAASSRSHSVFTCTVESEWESQGVTHHRFSRLNLVDLAGSERQKSSGAEGERLKEATNINKSLSTLGLVIMNLVNMSNGKNLHVPYRDSKLTFLLQDSLGGNAKTIIIANISPAISCSLETLSTLKFAQRAKYIKNHAIVNEDASGDVIAMRVQIQNLKKEVMHLKSLVHGGAENHETNDAVAESCPASPGPFKWEGFPGLSSPLISDKRKSQRKEYEVALVGAFRREKDKDIALEAMAAENKAAMQLAKQREDEIQGLKMRLRFREAGIKRMEAVASGKISAETHLLKEKEEHLKEIEVLRAQVDRNQEVTRFAMENLRLKEEIKRLKSFCEEGERERMTEHIATLQNKLLEALDWKLMHESDSSFDQKATSPLNTSSKDDLLLSTQDAVSPWRTSISEENEFLRMQAIQNQSELDSLQRKLDTYVQEKQKLQSYVNDLEAKLEKERDTPTTLVGDTPKEQIHIGQMLNMAGTDQIELKTMVDAISAASQREAEAHETAIILSKENEGLKMKLKFLIDDNNKLIELYEQAMEESKRKSVGSQIFEGKQAQDADNQFSQEVRKHLDTQKEVESLKNQLMEMHEENDKLMGLYEKAMHERGELMGMKHQVVKIHEENDKLLGLYEKAMHERDELMGLKHQLEEMHEENDKLMGLYEKAMKERDELIGMKHQLEQMHEESDKLMNLYDQSVRENDELKQIVASQVQNNLEIGELKSTEEVVEIDSGDNLKFDESTKSEESSMSIDEESLMADASLYEVNVQSYYSQCSDGKSECLELERFPNSNQSDFLEDDTLRENAQERAKSPKAKSNNNILSLSEDIDMFRKKLVEAQEKISGSAVTVSIFGSLERTIFEVDEISGKLERIQSRLQAKQEEYESYRLHDSELYKKKDLLDKKWGALRYSLSNFSTSINYFQQREVQTQEILEAAETLFNQKKDELSHLQACKDEILDKKNKAIESDSKLKSILHDLKAKTEGENQRLEKDRVLISIDNVDTPDFHYTQRNWQLSCRATELLQSAEMVTKFKNEMKQTQEKLGVLKKQHDELNKQLGKVESHIHVTQRDVENAAGSMEEMKRKLQTVIREKEALLEMTENGKHEFENLIIDYHQCIIETVVKKEELTILEEELEQESRQIEEIQAEKATALSRKSQLLEKFSSQSCFLSEKIADDLHCIRLAIVDLNSMLSGFLLNGS